MHMNLDDKILSVTVIQIMLVKKCQWTTVQVLPHWFQLSSQNWIWLSTSDSIKFKIETKYRFFQNYHVKYRYFVLLILTRKTNCYFSWLVIKTPQITLFFKQILISKLPQVPGTSEQAISSHKCFSVVSNHALQNLK